MINWPKMAEILPESILGSAQIKHFEVSKSASEFSLVRSAVTQSRDAYIPEGIYACLEINGHLTMSNTLMEQNSNSQAVYCANGHVLIAGLGLGMMLIPVCRKIEVQTVYVLEKNSDVIALVEPQVRKVLSTEENLKLKIIYADVFTWKPEKDQKFDTIWFDIWSDICTDNLKEVSTLKRRFARRLNRMNSKCWLGVWQERELRYFKRGGR